MNMNFIKKLKAAFEDAKAKRVKPFSDQGLEQQRNLIEFLERTGLQQDTLQDRKDDLAISETINTAYHKNGIRP